MLPLLHVPPVVVLVSVMVLPGHTADGPAIAAGGPFTVTVAVTVLQVVA